jgi:hypothetical protein
MADLHGAVGPQQYRQRRVEQRRSRLWTVTPTANAPRQLSTDPAIGFGWRRVHRTVQLLAAQGSSAVMSSNPRSDYRRFAVATTSPGGTNRHGSRRRTTEYVRGCAAAAGSAWYSSPPAICMAGCGCAGGGFGAGRSRGRPRRRRYHRHRLDRGGLLGARFGQRRRRRRPDIGAPVAGRDVAFCGAAPEHERRCRPAGTGRRQPVRARGDASGEVGAAGIRRVEKCRKTVGQ